MANLNSRKHSDPPSRVSTHSRLHVFFNLRTSSYQSAFPGFSAAPRFLRRERGISRGVLETNPGDNSAVIQAFACDVTTN